MTYDEARAAIESLFAGAWSATAVAYQNVVFAPPGDPAPWVRLSIENRGTVQASFGGTPRRFRCSGAVLVEIRQPPGAGTAAAYRLAGAVSALFAAAVVPGLSFEAAGIRPTPDADDDATFAMRVEVPFWHDDFR